MIIGEKFDMPDRLAPTGQEVAAAIVVRWMPSSISAGADPVPAITVGERQQHAKRRFGVQAIANHLAVPRSKVRGISRRVERTTFREQR